MTVSEAHTRKGDWIQTFTGGQFWPLDPRPDEVNIIDVAAALAKECRFGGHCRRFYSVAEHCVLMYREAGHRQFSARNRRAVLFHDASEGLGLRDIPRPIKDDIQNYKAIERGVMLVVAERFDFDWPLDPAVKVLDDRICRAEQLQNMAATPVEWSAKFSAIVPLPIALEYWPPDRAFVEFMSAAAELGLLRT